MGKIVVGCACLKIPQCSCRGQWRPIMALYIWNPRRRIRKFMIHILHLFIMLLVIYVWIVSVGYRYQTWCNLCNLSVKALNSPTEGRDVASQTGDNRRRIQKCMMGNNHDATLLIISLFCYILIIYLGYNTLTVDWFLYSLFSQGVVLSLKYVGTMM